MKELIEYLNSIRERLHEFNGKAPISLIMEEVSNIATNNWVQTGVPDLSKDQFNKVLLRVLSRGTTLN